MTNGVREMVRSLQLLFGEWLHEAYQVKVRSAVHHVSARPTMEPTARRAGQRASACECPSFLAAR